MSPHAERLIEILRYVLALQPGEQADLRVPGKDMLVSSTEAQTLPGFRIEGGDAWVRLARQDVIPRPALGEGEDPAIFDQALLAWQKTQQPKDLSNRSHAKLLSAYRDLKLDGGAETMEVVCGLGMMSGSTAGGLEIAAPLILQPCEILLHDDLGSTVEIQPAATLPTLNIPLVKKLWPDRLASLEAAMDGITAGDLLVSPADQSAAKQLFEAVSSWGMPITDRWCFFMRRRPSNRINKDIAALIQAIELGAKIPDSLMELVDRDFNPEGPGELPGYRGIEHAGGHGESRELYFPLPYNDEQVDIIQRLDSSNGVVVQGPPGTGKSHTIANIICHYLANGKTVLVSSGSAGALDVIRGKLPEDIRDLSASLLSSDAESLKEFEGSISVIVSKVAGIDPARSATRIAEAKSRVDQLHEEIGTADEWFDDLAERHLSTHEIGGEPIGSVDLARLATKDATHPYIQGGVSNVKKETLEGLVSTICNGRKALGSLLTDNEMHDHVNDVVIPSDLINEWARDAHRIKELSVNDNRETLRGESEGDIQARLEKATALAGRVRKISMPEHQDAAWVDAIQKGAAAMRRGDPLLDTIQKLLNDVSQHFLRVRELDGRISMDYSLMGNQDVLSGARKAIENMAAGKRAFSLVSGLGKTEERQFLASVTVDGEPPQLPETWSLVSRRIGDLASVSPIIRRWNQLSESAGWPEVDVKRLGSVRSLHLVRDLAETSSILIENSLTYKELSVHLGSLSGVGVDNAIQILKNEAEIRHLERKSDNAKSSVEKALGHSSFGRRVMREIEEAILNGLDVDAVCRSAAEKSEAMSQAQGTAKQLKSAGATLTALGAREWAEALLGTPMTHDGPDNIVRDDWWESWRVCVAQKEITKLGTPEEVALLLDRRRELSLELAREYRGVITDTAWLRMAENSTPKVRQALQKYLGAVRKIGQGTGMRAARHRAVAKEAMEEAHRAIPCWIMPQGRVSESMPAEIGMFDLVIMDEASQSGIDAIMTLMRGKKILIVGDDKQVSPSGVGRDEKTIIENRDTLLARQPYAHRMLPDQSIYDLFSEVFAGSTVMLKEHFRSSEAIIEYSNREYYGGQIIPLRVPDTQKRIDPPLVDVVLLDGQKNGDINAREAEYIADEIERISRDDSLSKRSVGVVTLTSNDKQAIEIKKKISEKLTDSKYAAMGISVGPPAQFQGKERDIMFVSMVWDGNSRDPGNRVDFQQRFNVALSRARDRMYLVRSIPDGHAKPDNLLDRIIRHFQDPFIGEDSPTDGDVIDKCETWFEREVARALLDLGYNVIPKVGRKGYRIDMVVEGDLGRRVAIECDGDRRWSEGQWKDAQRRQRVLERAGWTFWRCFQAHYETDREGTLDSLKKILAEQGIVPTWRGAGTSEWVRRISIGEPMAAKPRTDPDEWSGDYDTLSQKCDSPFETELLKYLLDAGYRVEPQYELRGYKIDLLVSDRSGNRMAIECDGDRFHGMDVIDNDIKRQAFLENTEDLCFWRIFYSDYMKSKAAAIHSLQEALDGAGLDQWHAESEA